MEFEAYASGGLWPARLAVTGTHVLLGVQDAQQLATIFTLNAAGLEQDFDARTGLLTPVGHPGALFALTLGSRQAGTEVRLLMWADQMRSALEALLERKAIGLGSCAAIDSLPDGVLHPELVLIELSTVDWRPLESALRHPIPAFRPVPTGWRVSLPTDATTDGAVEGRVFADGSVYSQAEAALDDVDAAAPLLHWCDDSQHTIYVAGLSGQVSALTTALSAFTDSAEITEDEARGRWAAFTLKAAHDAADKGLIAPLRNSPRVVAKRVTTAPGAARLIAFFIAYAYPDEQGSADAIAALSAEINDRERPLYVVRFRVAVEADYPWLVVALTLEHHTKDAIIVLDWGAGGVSVTDELTDPIMRNALQRHIGLSGAKEIDADDLQLADVPVALGP